MKSAKDQSSGLAFNGQGGAGYSRGSYGECVNQYSGKANDGALINKGRGPTKGNMDTTSHKAKRPPVASVPASTKIKNPDYINGGSQYRGVGGTSIKKPGAEAKINVGRGPTKGNE
jgi:hypothetical protein